MFNNFKLGAKICIVVSVCVLLMVLILSFIISYQSHKILLKEAMLLIDNANSRTTNRAVGLFDQVSATVQFASDRMNAALIRNEIISEQETLDIVNSLSKTSEFIEYAYVIFSNSHSFLSKNGNGFRMDDSVKNILNQNNNNDGLHISDPFRIQIQNENIFTIELSVNILNAQKQKIGTLGILYNLDVLSKDLLHARRSIFEGDRRFLMTREGVIFLHPNKDFLGKNLKEINPHQSAQDILTASSNNERGIYDYHFKNQNEDYMAATQLFNILNSKQTFIMVTLAPKKSIYQPFYDLLFNIIVTSLISILVVIVIISYYVKFYISTRIENVSKHLFSFFKYINFKSNELPRDLQPRANDEIGQMAKAINENILATKQGL
ncbi:MAG: methyl-accepting chemotaxis protein, partial [Campylobacter sp.]|nr:methyl-accepting chemotaxis protein [Campylobacter sp.]